MRPIKDFISPFKKVLLLLAALVISFIWYQIGSILFAGYTTKEYRLCDNIKNISYDFNKYENFGLYSGRIKSFVNRLEVPSRKHKYGCLDKNTDMYSSNCFRVDGYVRPIEMDGVWKLSNESFYTDPYGIHIFGNAHKHYYVALKKYDILVHVSLSSLNYIDKDLELSYSDKENLEQLRAKVCY